MKSIMMSVAMLISQGKYDKAKAICDSAADNHLYRIRPDDTGNELIF